MIKVLVIGCGNMGAAIASSVSDALECDVVAVDPDVARASSLLSPTTRVKVVTSLSDVATQTFDLGIIGVKPQYVHKALRASAPQLANAAIVSIAAGISIATMAAALPSHTRLYRVMPNLPASVGAAMTVGYAPQNTCSEDVDLVRRVFSAIGRFRWLEREALIDLATGVAGSGPGYVFAFVEYLAKAAESQGLSQDEAEEFARQTVIGAAQLLATDARSAQSLKAAVTSPGGTTAAGLAILEAEGGLQKLLGATVSAAAGRATEICEQLSNPLP